MAEIATGQANVTSTPSQIVPYDLTSRSVLIKNTGATVVYIGPSTVTSSTGYPLSAAEVAIFQNPLNNSIFGVTASGSSTIAYAEANG